MVSSLQRWIGSSREEGSGEWGVGRAGVREGREGGGVHRLRFPFLEGDLGEEGDEEEELEVEGRVEEVEVSQAPNRFKARSEVFWMERATGGSSG